MGNNNTSLQSLYERVRVNDGGLTNVVLRNENVDKDMIEKLAVALARNTNVRSLTLQDNLGDENLVVLFKGLMKNRSISTLNLASNKMTDYGMKQLVAMLLLLADDNAVDSDSLANNNNNRTNNNNDDGLIPLVELTLTWNQVTDDGAKVFANALISHPTLTKVEFHFNNISVEGMKAFLPALKKNSNLKYLSLSAPGLSPMDISNFKNYAAAEYGVADDKLKIFGQDSGANVAMATMKTNW